VLNNTISQKRLEANRRNALLSTGPKTAQGKAAVSRNAVRHGLTAALSVAADEDQDGFLEVLDELRQTELPVGSLEEHLITYIGRLFWRLQRTMHIETLTPDMEAVATLGGHNTEATDEICARASLSPIPSA
jgi:hypothetical protein